MGPGGKLAFTGNHSNAWLFNATLKNLFFEKYLINSIYAIEIPFNLT